MPCIPTTHTHTAQIFHIALEYQIFDRHNRCIITHCQNFGEIVRIMSRMIAWRCYPFFENFFLVFLSLIFDFCLDSGSVCKRRPSHDAVRYTKHCSFFSILFLNFVWLDFRDTTREDYYFYIDIVRITWVFFGLFIFIGIMLKGNEIIS